MYFIDQKDVFLDCLRERVNPRIIIDHLDKLASKLEELGQDSSARPDHATSLDLVGHADNHLLTLGGQVIDDQNSVVSALANAKVHFAKLSIKRIRLIGCDTKGSNRAKTVIEALERKLNFPVDGTSKAWNCRDFDHSGVRKTHESDLFHLVPDPSAKDEAYSLTRWLTENPRTRPELGRPLAGVEVQRGPDDLAALESLLGPGYLGCCSEDPYFGNWRAHILRSVRFDLAPLRRGLVHIARNNQMLFAVASGDSMEVIYEIAEENAERVKELVERW